MTQDEMVVSLKARQDILEARFKALLAKFIPFRKQVIQGLESFTDKAVENGIYGVSRFKRCRESEELVEIDFMLNYIDLVLLSTNDVNKLELDKEELAAKIFFYAGGDDSHTPLMEVNFIESIDQNHVIRAQWFSENGPRLFFKGKSMEDNVADRLVSSLLNHFYVWEYTWQEKPTLRSARGKESKRPFGLIPE